MSYSFVLVAKGFPSDFQHSVAQGAADYLPVRCKPLPLAFLRGGYVDFALSGCPLFPVRPSAAAYTAVL